MAGCRRVQPLCCLPHAHFADHVLVQFHHEGLSYLMACTAVFRFCFTLQCPCRWYSSTSTALTSVAIAFCLTTRTLTATMTHRLNFFTFDVLKLNFSKHLVYTMCVFSCSTRTWLPCSSCVSSLSALVCRCFSSVFSSMPSVATCCMVCVLSLLSTTVMNSCGVCIQTRALPLLPLGVCCTRHTTRTSSYEHLQLPVLVLF